MRRKGLLGLGVAVILMAGCGGDDDGDASGQEQEAQDAVAAAISAYQDQDYEALCEAQDERANEAIIELTKAQTCPEGYEELFARQADFGGVEGKPFDDFVEQLGDYEIGPATVPSEVGGFDAEVALEGPIEGVRSFLVSEDGDLKVSELFVTPDPGSRSETRLTP